MSGSDANAPAPMFYSSEEPVVDLRSRQYAEDGPSERELAGHRQLFIGVSVPQHQRTRNDYRRNRHNKRREHRRSDGQDNKAGTNNASGAIDPSQHVMFLLGEEPSDDSALVPHTVFCEMNELLPCKNHPSEMQWREAARWVKFEEDVEDGGERWSKPYVATLSVYYLFELRKCLEEDAILLNLDATTIEQIMDIVINKEIIDKRLQEDDRDCIRQVLLSRHSHLHEKKHHLPIIRSIAEIGRKHSSRDMDRAQVSYRRRMSEAPPSMKTLEGSNPSMRKTNSSSMLEKQRVETTPAALGVSPEGSGTTPDLSSSQKFDTHFLKKIPPGSETCNILVGEVSGLKKQFSCFVRLREANILGDLTEVPVPTRFIFLLLGPPLTNSSYSDKYHQMGRCMGTLMSDEVFHEIAYKARHRQDLLAGLDEFISMSSILPPAEWDPTIRIEPPQSVPSQDARKTAPNGLNAALSGAAGAPGEDGKGGKGEEGGKCAAEEQAEEGHGDSSLRRTGRLFGGLFDDIRRKLPWYLSDITDAKHVQILASFFFLYFACLTPIITFGGLLSNATEGNLGTIESIMCGCVVGITYALFSGQPMTILGSTGPVLVFESIVFFVCSQVGWNYLSFRLWIGIWVGLMLLLIVMFDLSYLVRYITRFTEESFASLIALIFIKEAIMKQLHIADNYPLNTDWSPRYVPSFNCSCLEAENNTLTLASYKKMARSPPLIYGPNRTELGVNWTAIDYFVFDFKEVAVWCKRWGGHLSGPDCDDIYVPDVFFFSCLLFLGTFVISMALKRLRTSRCFPARVRITISDFAVMIAIVAMTGLSIVAKFEVPRLRVPTSFEPTLTYKVRGWFIPPFRGNPWYSSLLAIPPAILATVLIFMDQQITAVIVNRKENKLKKGAGYHLDLLIVAVMIVFCSFFGMPWFVAATVLSINHVMSLKKESECTAPGERPEFLGCREQRVTGFLIFLFIGLSVFLTSILRYIPMSVLYGVFLYMGVSSMRGVQFLQRALIMLMPTKYQPNYVFLRHVPLWRVHLFTVVQILCLSLLWVVKSIKKISIVFPLMVLAMVFVRYFILSRIFSEDDLRWLDDIIPEDRKRKKEEEDEDEDGDGDGDGAVAQVEVASSSAEADAKTSSLLKGDEIDGDQHRINMSNELSKTSIWRTLVDKEGKQEESARSEEKKKPRKRHHKHRMGMGKSGQANPDVIVEMSPVKESPGPDREEEEEEETSPGITFEVSGAPADGERQKLLSEDSAPVIVVDPPSCEPKSEEKV